ncbi:LysR family transcriptional regulator [Vibrio sp. CAU 1672]|uniref:LysR family transcriptional regulator n=1 Tax=Vibrio sp. CAU 1672 TaxID=3032594 RepID=UPI0023DC9111|nr:LysR family transcriptional regulator [Vibrio sp. CAU 1672]MDF2155592.1 LysR family transcriptional regulator [Vibrio sp. CAU 1672]
MAKDRFHNLDLNLLKTFMVLIQEKNMRKASQRLLVSQPAISQALQKMRHHFNDELFVKVKTGLEPTPFAESLANQIAPILDELAAALNRSYQFNPGEIDHKLRIALSPITLNCLSGSLFEQLRQQAPRAQLELVSWNNNSENELIKGETLIGINYGVQLPNKEIYAQKLIDLSGRVLVRKDHPIKKTTAVPEDFSRYEIASLITPGWNDNFSVASRILTQRGIEHKIGFRSELVMAVIDVIQHTDMYFPHSNLFPVEQYPNLRAIDVAIDGRTFDIPVFCHTHLRNRNNPLVRWLFGLIQEILTKQVNK